MWTKSKRALLMLVLLPFCFSMFFLLDAFPTTADKQVKFKDLEFQITTPAFGEPIYRLLVPTEKGLERYSLTLDTLKKGTTVQEFAGFLPDGVNVKPTHMLATAEVALMEEASGSHRIVYSTDRELVQFLHQNVREMTTRAPISFATISKLALIEWVLLVSLLLLWFKASDELN